MSFLKYSASAGSGKTFTLVKEYLKIALGTNDPMIFSRILAITFTNKAANEMTDRILETLEEMSGVVTPMKNRSADMMKILSDELDVEEDVVKLRSRKTLKKIVHNYRDFSVGTIDSFVHKVIRSFAQEMGLNQTFEVELNTESVLKRAVDLMLDRVGKDPVLTRFIENYIDSKFEKGNTWKIDEDLYKFAFGLLRTHDWYYLDKAKSLDLQAYAEKYGELKKSVTQYENSLTVIAQKVVPFALDGVLLEAYARGGYMVKYFQQILDGEFKPKVNSWIQKFLEPDSNWVSVKGKNYKEAIEGKRSQIIEWFLEVEKIRDEGESKYVLENLLYSNLYRVALLSEIDKEVVKIKAENDLVLISDFNTLVSDITRNEPVPFIYEKLGEKYQHFLFDEFQDTSLMQWHNMLPLVENSLANRGMSMVVGDAKQSIYRWRGGVVEQFGMLPTIYNPYNDEFAQERGRILNIEHIPTESLQVNYRSQAKIIEFNNSFFADAANIFGGQVEGFYEDVEQKINGQENEGYVEFRFFYDTKEEALKDVFAQIAELIDTVKADGYDLKDIAILTKTKGETPQLVEYLNDSNINVISSESLLVKNSPYVNLVMAVLHHLNHPAEPFFMNEILVRINEIWLKESFHTVMGEPDKMTQEKFLTTLLSWGYNLERTSILTKPLYELVTGVLNVFDANDVKDNRLAAWINYVYEKSLKVGFGLYDLLDDWRLQQDKLSIQIPDDVDAVNVMTIHAAKGLDWPVVILAQGNWQGKHKEHSFWVEFENEDPVPAALIPHTSSVTETKFNKEYEEEENAIILDNLNAMYVAFTRPAERLYVFSIKPKTYFFKELFPVLLDFGGFAKLKYHDFERENKKGQIKIERELVKFSYGETSKNLKDTSKPNSNLLKIPNRRNSTYQQKLKVKKNYIKRMNDSGQRDFGNLVHKAFSFINSAKDVDKTVNDLHKSGEISKEEKVELKEHILHVIEHAEASKYFDEKLNVKNEAEIILANGDLLRPDRVVIENKNATVIDFKTGMKKPAHEQQVLAYKNQLLKMGYNHVTAVLIYTGEAEIVEVG